MKYMNRITLCVSLCMLALFCSCDEERDIRWTTVEIDVWYPSDLSGISVESETFEFRNITSGMVTSFTTRKGITLPEGLYDCSYEAAITYQTADSTIHTSLSGYARSLELMGAQGSVSIGSYQVENKDENRHHHIERLAGNIFYRDIAVFWKTILWRWLCENL